MYTKITDKRTLYCDVDDTLIKWNCPIEEQVTKGIELVKGVTVVPHEANIAKLRQFKVLGYIVVVWSQSGSDHAEKVVNLLDLIDVVDVVISKPTYFMDDLPTSYFMPEHNRIWKEDKKEHKEIKPSNSW